MLGNVSYDMVQIKEEIALKEICDFDKLALYIRDAGKLIAIDKIAKDWYLLRDDGDGTIVVTSSNSFEAITIGDMETTNGYMHLYQSKSGYLDSFPTVEEISRLLLDVAMEKSLEVGDGKAGYYDLPEYGGLQKQRRYFANIVKRMAKCDGADMAMLRRARGY